MPDDELPPASGLDDDGRCVAGVLRGERAPQLLARVLVERDGCGAVAADEADQLVTIEQRVSSETPQRRLHAKVFLERARPNDLAILRIETEEVAFSSQREDPSTAHHRRRARAGVVAHAVGRVILMLPNRFTRRLVKTQHALGAAHHAEVEGVFVVHLRALRHLAIRDEHAPAGDYRAGETRIHRHAPTHLRPTLGERLHDASLAPNRVALRAEPLRPVVGVEERGGNKRRDEQCAQAKCRGTHGQRCNQLLNRRQCRNGCRDAVGCVRTLAKSQLPRLCQRGIVHHPRKP